MYLYSIIPLDTEHLEERCQDIKRQYEEGISDCALFLMTLHPDGNPAIDKAEIQCKKYDLFKERLAEENLECGVLVQSTLGHSAVPNVKPPFQSIINLSDGKEGFVICPEDDDFCDYLTKQMEIIAKRNPKAIMIDDDLRLTRRRGRGCACEKHMKMFNEKAGLNFSREELYDYVMSHDLDDPIMKIFLEVQDSSLVKAAKAIRKGIDKVNPKIQGVLCGIGKSIEVENILKGEGNPSVLRVSNGCYTLEANRNLFSSFYQAASIIQSLKGKIDYFLAEGDTCPHNRYSVGAYAMHTHYTGSVLEGVCGAKRWITKLNDYEPNSDEMFRRVHGKYRGFYDALTKTVKELKPFGAKIPMPKVMPRNEFKYANPYEREMSGFASMVLSRFGIPLYFSSDEGGIAFVDEVTVNTMTDEEVLGALKRKAFLSALAAKALCERGFGEHIGVSVKPWTGLPIRGELDSFSGGYISPQFGLNELVPMNDKVESISTCYSIENEEKTMQFPGVAKFKNSLGGTVITFAGTPCTQFTHKQAFSFLNETRKRQILNIMNEDEALPVYYYEDAELYMRAGCLNNGEIMCALFDLGTDKIENLPLVIKEKITKAEILTCDGTRKEINFREENGIYIFDLTIYPLEPVILFVK